MEAESATAESISVDVQIYLQNPSYEDIDSMTKTRTSEERTETSNSVQVGRKKNIEGNFLAQAPSGVPVSPREILKDSDATSHAEQQHEENEIPKYEDLQGIDSVSKLGDQKKETMKEDLQSEEEQTNLCIPAAKACLGNKKATNENSKNNLDSASDNLITSQDKNAPKYGENEENIKDDATGYKNTEEGIHKSQRDDNLLTGLDVVKLAETSLLRGSFQNHKPADTVKNAEEKETETEVQHMSKDVENIPTEDNILLDGKEGPHGPINGNKELVKESSHVESDDNIIKSSEEREEQEKDTQKGKQKFLRDSTDKDEKIEERSFLPAKQVSEETYVHDKEISDPKKGLENDVQEEEKAAEESYITTSISELDKEMLSAIGAEEILIHEEVSDSPKDKGRIQDELEMDAADSNVTKHEIQEALEVNAEESLIVNETKSGEEYNKPEMFDYKEDAKRNAKVHDESCNSSSHGPLKEASAHDNKERNSETKMEEITNEASNQENLELGNTKDGKGSNLIGNIDSDPNKPEIRLQILELQNQISGEDENETLFNMKERLEVTKGVDHDFIIVKKNNEGKEATEPGHLILNEVEKLEKSSHVSSDEIPKPSEPDNKQENKVMKNKDDFLEVQQSKDKHEIREEQKNIPANQVSEDETFHDEESIDSREPPEKYVQEEKEAKESINTLSIPESFKKPDSALESKETENSKGVPNFLKDKDQIQEALVKDVKEEKAGEESTNILSILESYKKTDSALKAKEKKNSEEVSNFLKDKDQIQDEPNKDVADTHKTKYDSQVAPKVNAEILKENETTTGAEHNKLEMLEYEEDDIRSAEIHDGSCDSSSHSLLNKGSKHEDTERDCKTRVKKIVNEAVNQEKLEGNVKDGSECNQVDNCDGVPKVHKISQRILKPQKEIANKNKMTMEMEERHQEVTEENDQDLSVMKQKNERKEANESGLLIINRAEHEESSCVASDENIPKPSKPSNKKEKEALVRKNDHFEEDQQIMDKDETKEEQNLVLFNEVSEETIIHDQGREDPGTKVQEEEKVVTPSVSESNKETDSAIGEKETENSKEVSKLMKDKDQVQEEFHKDVVDTRVSKYDVQETLETNANENFTGNEAVTGTEKNDLGMLEDGKDANIKAKIHDDSCNGSSNGLLKKAYEHDDTERDPEPKKVENVDEAIEEEQLDLLNIQEGSENNKVGNFDVVANLSKTTQQILESQKKIAGKNKMILEERLQEATEEVDQDLSVMKQKNKDKETTESGQLIGNMDEECEECVAAEEYIHKLSETRKKQEKEAVEREGHSLEEDQQTENKDERKEEQNLIPVNEISEEAIIHDQGTEDSGKGFETKVQEEEKVDTEGSVTPSIPELNKETVSAIGEEETENSEKVSNFLKDKNQIQDEFQKDAVDTHVSKYDVQEALGTNAEESFTGNKTVTGTENNDIGMLEDEEDANKRDRVHDDSCNGSSNGLLTIASEHKVTERDPEVKKVEKVVEVVKQEKLDLVNTTDGRESNQVDKFDVLPNIAKISQQILAGKDEMILEERLQEATEEIDQDLSVTKQKNEDKKTTESVQLTVNMEEEYGECVASEECIPKPSEPTNKQEKEAMEKKGSFLEKVQQTKEKDETREDYHIPVNEISEEANIHDIKTSDSKKGLETKARAEEKVDKESTITPSNSEKNKEAESIKREKETENSEKVSNFLKDKNQIQDEFHKDVFDTHVAKYDVEESIETNSENSLTGNEAGKGTENINLLEDEEDAHKRSKVYDGSCDSPSLLNGTSEHEDIERDPEQKKEDIADEANKQKKVELGNIEDGRESNQVNDFDVVSDIREISQQSLEHQTEITGKDEKILEMKGVEEVNKEIDKHLYLTKPNYEASSTEPNETDSSSGKHKSDLGAESDIASIVMSAYVFSPNKSAAKNDGAVISKTDDDPYEVPAHIKETTHIDDKRNGAAAESSMQSQGKQQHQKKQVYESITEGKPECIKLEEMPIKNKALATMKDMLNAQVKKLPHRSIEEQEIDMESRERVLRIQNACDEVDKSIDYNEIESKLVGQNSDTHCPCANMIIDQTTCMTANEGHKKEVTDDIRHKIAKNTVAEEHISEAAVSCLEDQRTDEKLLDDGNKNNKTEQIPTEKEQELKPSDATERKVPDDKIKESMSSSSEEKLAVTGFSEKMNPKDEENSSKKLDFHRVIASLEETTQQEGDVLFVPKTNVQRKFKTGTVDEEHFKERKRDFRTISSEIKDVEGTYAHESNKSDEDTPIEATESQSSNGTSMTETKCQEGNKKKTDETGPASKDDTGKEYSSAGIGKHEKNLQNVSVVSQQVATSPSEERDMLQPSKEVHNKIIEVGKFNDEKNQPDYNDFPEPRFLLDPIFREDKLNKSYVLELENKPKEKNELEKIDASIKEQVTTALLPSEQTSEKKCTSDEAEAQNFEQFTDIKQEEKNNQPKGTANTFPSSEHASIERDTSEEAATEYQKIEQTTNSMQDEKNNDVKEDKINMITIKDGTQDSNIYDSSVVTPTRVGVENVFSCNNPFPEISNKHTISSTSQVTTLEQVQIFIDDLEDTDLVLGEKDNEVNLEKQIKESGIHEVKEIPQEGFSIPSSVIVPDDNFSYEEDGNEKEVLQNAGNFNKASNAIPQESSPLIVELNKKEKKLVQREVNLPTCESTEHSILQEAKLHGIMNVHFKIKRIESEELNPIQVSRSEAQDVKNVSSKMNLADTLNIQNTDIENSGTCKKEGEKSVLAQVEENETDREKDEQEEKEDCADRTVQVAEKIVEDCMLVSKGEKGNIETTINQVGGDNNDEERDQKEAEEGHKEEEPGYEASINVDSRVVVKPTHKKSHNILSGVGSKVKQSIAKVKKVITCKSLHSKTST